MKYDLESIRNQVSDQIAHGTQWEDCPSLELVDRGRDGTIATFMLSGVVDVDRLTSDAKCKATAFASDGFCFAVETWEFEVCDGEINGGCCVDIEYKALEEVPA